MIAEAGANHNRDLGMARELIDVAADAGADAVKFQTYSGKASTRPRRRAFEYLEDDRSPQRAARRDRAAARVAAGARRARASARDRILLHAVRRRRRSTSLAEVGVPAMKIASFELVDLPLISHAAANGRPADPLDRDGDVRRDRGRARRGRGRRRRPRSRCCAARRSIPRRSRAS